jgi:hypothetical protein
MLSTGGLGAAGRSLLGLSRLVFIGFGWALLGLSVFSYIAGDLLELFPVARHVEILAGLLGLLISCYFIFYNGNKPTQKPVIAEISLQTKRVPGAIVLASFCSGLRRFVRRSYAVLYQTTDVVFCVGAPMLVLTAFVGWWLIDEIDAVMLLFYLGLICLISVAGIYNNLVRMIAIGYFNGYWLIDLNMLSYPFEAPLRVSATIELMYDQAGAALWPLMLTAALLFYLTYWLVTSKRKSVGYLEGSLLESSVNSSLNSSTNSSAKKDFQLFEKLFSDSLVAKVLVAIILLVAAPICLVFIDAMVNVINVHCFFAALAIFWMDALWRVEFEQEPSLCGDCRYLLSGDWRP